MSEPEELILEGAHFATRVARDVWRRHVPASPEVQLADVRGRLELFVTALFQTPITIGTIETPAPATWLSKLAHRSLRACDASPLCGTDEERVLLPPLLSRVRSEEDTVARYRLLAVQQAARLCRQTPRVFARIQDRRTRDWFILAEAAIIDYWI